MRNTDPQQGGFTLVELLVALLLAGILLAATGGIVQQALGTGRVVEERNALLRDARFAMGRIVRMAGGSRQLLLPLADNPATGWPEHIREQTVPASPPVGGSTLATAVLAVSLPEFVDLDADGFADADDDKDGLFDEDLPSDSQHDFQPGVALIDDDGDGAVDDGSAGAEDDEDGVEDEDAADGIDNDGDGNIDEDPPADNNGDGCPGVCGVDDNGNGTVDDGGPGDNDEDGASFEDPYDPVVFYLAGSTLVERMPVPWNEDGIDTPDGPVDGRDFIVSPIAGNVTQFRVERLSSTAGGKQSVHVTLELTGPSGAVVSAETRVRIGGAL